MTIIITQGAVITIFVAVMFGHLVWNYFDIGLDDSDLNGRNRSGVHVVTDHKTGLQYLCGPGGGLTPRLDAGGHQIKNVADSAQ